MRASLDRGGGVSRTRLVVAYVVMAVAVAAAATVAFIAGSDREAVPAFAGIYETEAAGCLQESFTVRQSGEFVDLEGAGDTAGKLRYEDGRLRGDVTCADGGTQRLDAAVLVGETPEDARLSGTAGESEIAAVYAEELPEPGASAEPAEKRSGEETFGRLMLAIAVVILAARLMGAAVARIGQPHVMGEIIAGILLGPTLLGAVAPDVKNYFFPADIVPLITAAAFIGLAFYMFLVGLELDPAALRERAGQAALVSNASVALPMALGLLAAVPFYELLAPDVRFLPFALFMGVAMSITAFPVLARILIERRMLRRPVGMLALASAAIDDVTAWGLLALASAVAGTGSGSKVGLVIGLSIAFCIGMFLIVRRILARVSRAYDEAGHIPSEWIAAIFVGILLSAFLAQQIGIAAIFGAFVMGLIMPRRADLTGEVTERIESFVVTVLLPLFFVVTGLRTEVGLLNRVELWLLTLVLLAVAVAGKWLGAMLAARYGGFSWRESGALGALMNTRGLTELIVLNIGLELGVITPALFTMLVIVALVTTFMAGPALRLIDRRGELSAPAEEELRTVQAAPAAPERSLLVAPQDERNLDALLAVAAPLARSQPPRELILARLLPPPRIAPVLATQERDVARAIAELTRRRDELAGQAAVRVIAFTSPDAGHDLVRLASEQEVDLLLLDGRRPLLGEGVPRGEVGHVLEHAPSDVAVLVESDGGVPTIGPDAAVIVPFGGAEHDWAALELGAWIATDRGAPLRLLGSAGDSEDGRDASRLLGNASLVVQQLAGITAEPVLAEPGREGLMRAAEQAGLLVVGLSERWREEGLGPVRSEIARTATVPTLFVRRGLRPGALAPREDVTRFTWSAGG
jgi:Kef-type K+ transport system membrane component KefB